MLDVSKYFFLFSRGSKTNLLSDLFLSNETCKLSFLLFSYVSFRILSLSIAICLSSSLFSLNLDGNLNIKVNIDLKAFATIIGNVVPKRSINEIIATVINAAILASRIALYVTNAMAVPIAPALKVPLAKLKLFSLAKIIASLIVSMILSFVL